MTFHPIPSPFNPASDFKPQYLTTEDFSLASSPEGLPSSMRAPPLAARRSFQITDHQTQLTQQADECRMLLDHLYSAHRLNHSSQDQISHTGTRIETLPAFSSAPTDYDLTSLEAPVRLDLVDLCCPQQLLRDDDYGFASNSLEAYYVKAACARPFTSQMIIPPTHLPTKKSSRVAPSLKVPKKTTPTSCTDQASYDSRAPRERRGRRKAKHTSTAGTANSTVTAVPQSYHEIVGSMVELCLRDQSNCRHMQRLLRDAEEDVQRLILRETVPHFSRLMSDPIGNYFCQSAMQLCTEEELALVVEVVWNQLPVMSKSMYATRAVQKLILRCQASFHLGKRLAAAFVGHIHELAVDACGNHVVRELLQTLPSRCVDFVHTEIRCSVLSMATTKRGCCAVQKSLEHGNDAQKQSLIEETLPHIQQLILDPFGNYVVQHVLRMGSETAVNHVTEIVLLDLVAYSKHKFASNVVEVCLRRSSGFAIGAFVGVFVALGKEKLTGLLEDCYGNYVIQQLIEVTPHSGFGPLNRLVSLCMPNLARTVHGRRIAQILVGKYPFLTEVPPIFANLKKVNDVVQPVAVSSSSENSLAPDVAASELTGTGTNSGDPRTDTASPSMSTQSSSTSSSVPDCSRLADVSGSGASRDQGPSSASSSSSSA